MNHYGATLWCCPMCLHLCPWPANGAAKCHARCSSRAIQKKPTVINEAVEQNESARQAGIGASLISTSQLERCYTATYPCKICNKRTRQVQAASLVIRYQGVPVVFAPLASGDATLSVVAIAAAAATVCSGLRMMSLRGARQGQPRERTTT
jgi:hypothetical protein